jgi:light-regulated signal transduction histidine kinase (bacteriophytochrome)
MSDVDALQQEFSDFSYAVSHDLNAPFRHIKSFTQLLLDEFEPTQLTEDQKEYAAFIVRGVDRMQTMLEGLVDFSRLNTTAKPFKDVDVNEVLKESTRLFQERVSQEGGMINLVGNLSSMQGDADQLQIAFNALLDNAFKFRHPQRPLEIRIQSENNTITFQDNGIGIAVSQPEEAFKPLKQLQHMDEYPGVGMGLALVKKIIQRHSGTTDLISDGETGTSVVISFSS